MRIQSYIRPAALAVLLHSALMAQPAGTGQPVAKAEITELSQALAGIPQGVMGDLRPGSRKKTDAIFTANEQVRKNVKDKAGQFKMTVRNIEKFATVNPPGMIRYRVYANAEKIRVSGTSFNAFVVAVVDPGENEKAAKLEKGDKITIAGRIISGEVYGVSHPGLEIYLAEARLE